MRYPASEKLEIIRIVEQSHLPAKRTLDHLGIPRRTFYRWYDRYLEGGPEALEDRPSAPSRVWNRIPASIHNQIIELALERAFLIEPLPTDEAAFKKRIEEGRGRLTLIASEIARNAGAILVEYAAAARKLKDSKASGEMATDIAQQLQRLVHKRFLLATPYAQLAHFPRYLKAVQLRIDKARTDLPRDTAKLAELRPQDQRFWRLVAERKGVQDARLQELRWLLEELRVSFFAQELRTPQPVSIKRLDKVWQQLQH